MSNLSEQLVYLFPFSFGNPDVELKIGFMNLQIPFTSNIQKISQKLENDSFLVAILNIPDYITIQDIYEHICQFCKSILSLEIIEPYKNKVSVGKLQQQEVFEIVSVRSDTYAMLIRFDSVETSTHFITKYDGYTMNLIDEHKISVLSVLDIFQDSDKNATNFLNQFDDFKKKILNKNINLKNELNVKANFFGSQIFFKKFCSIFQILNNEEKREIDCKKCEDNYNLKKDSNSAKCTICLENLFFSIDSIACYNNHQHLLNFTKVGSNKKHNPIIFVFCRHIFHLKCIVKQSDSTCPICRFTIQPFSASICEVCNSNENLYMCLVCGSITCNKLNISNDHSNNIDDASRDDLILNSHAHQHWKISNHSYSLEIKSQRVQDYCGQDYVSRLIQNKTDGKIVSYSNENEFDVKKEKNCSDIKNEQDIINHDLQSPFNIKLNEAHDEYNYLLRKQTTEQRNFYQKQLSLLKLDQKNKINNFKSKIEILERENKALASKILNSENYLDFSKIKTDCRKEIELLQKEVEVMQTKLDQSNKRNKTLTQLNDNLLKQKKDFEKTLEGIKTTHLIRMAREEHSFDLKVQELKDQLRDLRFHSRSKREISIENNINKDIRVESVSTNNRKTRRELKRRNKHTKNLKPIGNETDVKEEELEVKNSLVLDASIPNLNNSSEVDKQEMDSMNFHSTTTEVVKTFENFKSQQEAQDIDQNY